MPERTPLTILGGFLGAGKTSLLRYVLEADHGRRVAVVVNDFGDLDVDAQQIVNVEGETVSLQNGCVCCTVRDDLLGEVVALLGRPGGFDHVVIETSGVSDQTLVAQTFSMPDLQGLVEVAAVLTLVDASEFLELAEDHAQLAERQLQAADVVVVNKVDLARPEQLEALRAHLAEAVPRARRLEARHGRVPPPLLFGLAPTLPNSDRFEALPEGAPGRSHEAAPAFQTWSYRTSRPISLLALRKALEELPEEIYRAKGWVHVEQAPGDRADFQLTGRRAWLRLGEPWGERTRETRLNFIGRPSDLRGEELAALFDDCAARFGGRAPGAVDQPVRVKDLRGLSVLFG